MDKKNKPTKYLIITTIIALLTLLSLTLHTPTGMQVDENILFEFTEEYFPAEQTIQQQILEEPQQQIIKEQPQEELLQKPAQEEFYPEIPKPDANPECLQKCDTGFSLCLHRAEGDDKKTRKCYGSQEGCYLKCKEIS